MKIIKAKQSGIDRTAYINADNINSFHVFVNDNGKKATKIYFCDGKCEIEGDKADDIARFMMRDDEGGLLDLTVDERPRRCERRFTLSDLENNSEIVGMSGTNVMQTIFKGANEIGAK